MKPKDILAQCNSLLDKVKPLKPAKTGYNPSPEGYSVQSKPLIPDVKDTWEGWELKPEVREITKAISLLPKQYQGKPTKEAKSSVSI